MGLEGGNGALGEHERALRLRGRACGARTAAQSGLVVSVRDFGAVAAPGRDNTPAIQRAIDEVGARGGGTVEIPGQYECGIVTLGDGVILRGSGGWLVNGRVVIPEARQGCRVDNLGIVSRHGDANSFALDVAGRNCTFDNVTLVKDPIAGGYQMFLRQTSANCSFTGLNGRRLASITGDRVLFEDQISRTDEVVLEAQSTPQQIRDNLAEVLHQLLAPLYERFGFFRLQIALVEEELGRMVRGRF